MATFRVEGGREVAAEAYVEEVVGAFRRRLTERYAASPAVQLVEAPDAVADRLALLVPLVGPRNEMADLVGPCYDTAGMRTLLGTTRQAIHDRTMRGTLLGVQTAEGQWVYPTFQFDGARPREDLAEVMRALRGGPRWSVAVWLRTPGAELDHLSPEQWLAKGGDPARVLSLAQQVAHQWAA